MILPSYSLNHGAGKWKRSGELIVSTLHEACVHEFTWMATEQLGQFLKEK